MQSIRSLFLSLLPAFVTPVHAAIVYFDIPDQTLYSGSGSPGYLFMDLDAAYTDQSYKRSFFEEYDLWIYLNSGAPQTLIRGNWRSYVESGTSDIAAKFSLNQELTGGTKTSVLYIDPNSSSSSPWNGETGQQKYYLGYVNPTTQQKAWVGVYYNDAADSITITDFAVGNSSDNLRTGVVPEPAETALILALATGGFALLYRRKSYPA